MTTLSILDSSGDTKLSWTPDNPKSVEDARKTVADLKAAGYAFFMATGEPADEVAAGGGELEFRRIDPEELVNIHTGEPATATEIATEQVERKKPGRPARQAVAVPKQQGG